MKREQLQKIIAHMATVAKENGIALADLSGGGAVYYLNGLNGTYWDVKENGHLPRIFCVWNENNMGAITVIVNRDGSMDTYVYGKHDAMPAKSFSGKCPADFDALWEELDALDVAEEWDAKVGSL